jgi:hypothetical protein
MKTAAGEMLKRIVTTASPSSNRSGFDDSASDRTIVAAAKTLRPIATAVTPIDRVVAGATVRPRDNRDCMIRTIDSIQGCRTLPAAHRCSLLRPGRAVEALVIRRSQTW